LPEVIKQLITKVQNAKGKNMKRIFISIWFISILFFSELNVFAQTYGTFDWSTSNYRRGLTKTSSSNPTSSGLSDLSSQISSGRYVLGGTTYYDRAFYQWSLPNNVIPDNVVIDTVQIRYEYYMYADPSGNHPFKANFYNCINDLISGEQSNLSTLWNNSEDPYKQIASNQTGSQGVLEKTYGPGSGMVNVIQSALSSDKFVLGIRYTYETTYDSVWYIKNPTLNLRVVFSYAPVSVIVDQKLSDNSSIDSVGLWNPTYSIFDKYLAPKTFNWNLNSTRTLQGARKIISNQKYSQWKKGEDVISDVTNHHSFVIDEDYAGVTLTSQFTPTYSGVAIKNEFPEASGLNPSTDSVEFKDPWFIDYPDPEFGNQLRNRGMNDAIFYQRPSPFYPDYTTSYGGRTYKGVFLNQSGPGSGWQGAYYKVGMLTDQPITINGQERKFFPYKWQNDGGVTFQDEYARQTGVVFTSSNATATALLKGQLISNDENGVKNPSQRKMVRTDNGQYHIVYESMGTVWYTYSLTSNFYGSWGPEVQLDIYGKNPAIDYEADTVMVVFETYNPQYGGDANIRLYSFVPSGNGFYDLW
jgi:hypothetical protein